MSWQTEATIVINQWEDVYEEVCRRWQDVADPHWLGRSKSEVVLAYIDFLTGQRDRLNTNQGQALAEAARDVIAEWAITRYCDPTIPDRYTLLEGRLAQALYDFDRRAA